MTTLTPRYGSVAYLCRLLDLAASSYYYAGCTVAQEADEQAVSQVLQDLAGR